jgi:chlorophyllase
MRQQFLVLLSWLCVGSCVSTPSCPRANDGPADGAAPSGQAVFKEGSDPYAAGPLAVRTVRLAACERGNPVPVVVLAPDAQGRYPVVVFFHGFMSRNDAYSELLTHLASHGYVVVAPQMYEPGLAALFGFFPVSQEVRVAAGLLEWVSGSLAKVVGYAPATEYLGLAGHSRGGSVAWWLLAEKSGSVLAVAGVDPVGAPEPVRSNSPAAGSPSGETMVPALVIGCVLSQRCAPAGRNHEQFYAACESPAWHVIIPGAGHADMLDDAYADLAAIVCPAGADRAAVRQLIGGLLVAFFRVSLQGDQAASAYLTDPTSAPLAFQAEAR